MKTTLKRIAYSVAPFALLVMWWAFLAPEVELAEYIVLLALFTLHGLVQFWDGIERGAK